MTNAATIKAAREAAGLSAREAAALVGVATVTWQRWEGQSQRRTEIPYAHWTLFLLLVGAHPEMKVVPNASFSREPERSVGESAGSDSYGGNDD